ncbi:MAG TPA: alkaline phosphatase family protein [Acidobacteriota bacterium]|nr:alkaline phosphatase family protein [Acidobacteriota bacterium]
MIAALALLILLVRCDNNAGSLIKKSGLPIVIVLGFDGADPKLVQQWIDDLPNIRKLQQDGLFQPLGTTNPPESPVAWASFATGMNPGKHNIFDFLKRDPKTYFPDIGLVEIHKSKWLWGTVPISKPRLINQRKGATFWKLLDQAGVSADVLRMPLTFPPEQLSHGRLLSGLGVPDVRGTWGTYFYYATDLTQWDIGDTEFGGKMVRLELKDDGSASTEIEGPQDPRRTDYKRVSIPMKLQLNTTKNSVRIEVQGQTQEIQERQWSDWFNFQFSAGPFVRIHGSSRFFVLETYPELRLYLSPISLDPKSPPTPISSPAGYSAELVGRLGMYKSLGWIHETWGLNEERIDEDVFLQDLFRNMDMLEKMLLSEIREGRSNFYAAVFTATDSASHMFYRLMDPLHPRYEPELAAKFGDAVKRIYQRMDSILGNIQRAAGQDAILIVVSDHGFHTWRKEFNTNTWLVRSGFMLLQGMESDPNTKKLDNLFSGGSFFPNVDWSRTQAYALGLGQIYINMKGREGKGIVTREEYPSLVRKIAQKIVQYRDPDSGDLVLENAYLKHDIYHGPYAENAGDIQISFRSGYRTSWQTSLGAVPENILVANLKKWSGDHCASDESDTQGILLINRKVVPGKYRIIDIAPTVLKLFNVPIPADIDGQAIAVTSR